MKRLYWIAPLLGLAFLASCAGGPGSKWDAPNDLAGFWVGLWHGALMLVTLIVSFFTNEVSIYEIDNTGVAYNIGFVLGVLCVYGSGTSATVSRTKSRRRAGGERVFRAKVERWVEEEDWDELGEKIERKIKSKLRRWLEEDEKPPRSG